ncbi:putative transcription factor & chromatin remodeling ARID family [Helianthus annuus]|uniref:Transcription factor & chromatin remodeling ARID family n=1 Tax=Helianthus annuus TaxID=4232 RepID=A0A9K3HRC5_HELAN|nr:putative transcription factor & chromatin remodeling ARID family [Helianthus annuus]
MNLNDVNEKYKEGYLNSYFEDLNVSSHETDWSVMIIRAMEFKDFNDCKALLEMMEDGKFVFQYKHELERKLEEMLQWFITVKLGITTRPIPPQMVDNKKIDLLGMYMIVERDGGYRSVTDDNLWPVIAKDMGYEYQDREYMRIIYAMYLDVLVYNYRFKDIQEKAHDKEMMNEGEPSSKGCHERSVSAEAVKEVAAIDHYALYADNDWEGAWKMHKRRRKFDFKEARKAVDEANKSVLMFAAKHN